MFLLSAFSVITATLLTTLCEGQFSICRYERLRFGAQPLVSPKSYTQILDEVPVNSSVVYFHSPLPSENISETQECILQVKGFKIIQISVTTFDLGGHDPCSPEEEHLSIAFYHYYNSDLIRNGYPRVRVESNRGYLDTVRWCGRSYSTRLETRQQMIIRYFPGPHTGRGAGGFNISFSQVDSFECGQGQETIGDQPMYIYSPGYPALYDNNMYSYWRYCDWELVSRRGRSLQLESLLFSLEQHHSCNYDYLSVNGEKYCGDQRIWMRSQRNTLDIKFSSDRSNQYDGFILKIVETEEDVAGCGQHVVASTAPRSLHLTNPNPGQFYAVNCWWLVDGGGEDRVVMLENTHFTTTASCTEFELSIYDGTNRTRSNRILSSCAPMEMFRVVRSSSRYLSINVDIQISGYASSSMDVVYTVTSHHRDAVPRVLYAGYAESYVWLNLATSNDLGYMFQSSVMKSPSPFFIKL